MGDGWQAGMASLFDLLAKAGPGTGLGDTRVCGVEGQVVEWVEW